ncbi:hypothetical protein [Nannocystis punicea]|uniref:Uncharacterized protein n=1 Tax=Nannocystis punicea TaxID=2995304 RepID=A0ABY7H2C2_9BACT|nr:hypothetical protein [Nannocystis poenicansa]WAS93214.1 hypothetical protein O0S08_44195 [Nannocystis poenicansa]
MAATRAQPPIGRLFAAPPAPPELASDRPEFATTFAPDDTPWVLTNGDVTEDGRYALVLLHRDAEGAWTHESLAAEAIARSMSAQLDTRGDMHPAFHDPARRKGSAVRQRRIGP